MPCHAGSSCVTPLDTAFLMVCCLWLGFFIGRRRDADARYLPIMKRLGEAARKLGTQAKFVGPGPCVPTFNCTMDVDGKDFTIAMMEAAPGRSFAVCQTVDRDTTHPA